VLSIGTYPRAKIFKFVDQLKMAHLLLPRHAKPTLQQNQKSHFPQALKRVIFSVSQNVYIFAYNANKYE
jgi:hypothetical protein